MDSPTFFLSLVIVAIIVFLIVAMYPRQQPNTTGKNTDTTDSTTTIYTYPQTTGITSWPFYTYPTYTGYYRPWNNSGSRRWGGGGRRWN